MIDVMIFDDNATRRESLQMLLESHDRFNVVGNFPNCLDIIAQVNTHKPQVILMDIQMPGRSGIEAVRLLNKNFSDVKIIMQTVFDDSEMIFDALRFGASGYILKKTEPEIIIQAIEDVMKGGSPMTPVIATKVLNFFRGFQNQTETSDYGLSDREKDILNLLVDGKSYKMIAEKLNISYHTVNSHIKKIYEKLQVHSLSEAISKAIQSKLV
jgi:DNA-binding NarL/FixJ family response regulator